MPTEPSMKDLPEHVRKEIEEKFPGASIGGVEPAPLPTHHRERYQRRRVSIDHQNPHAFVPNGDRYLVELLDIEENVTITGPDGNPIKLILPETIPAKVQRNQQTGQLDVTPEIEREMLRGWRAGVILKVGNGHRLETPDGVQTIANILQPEEGEVLRAGKMPASLEPLFVQGMGIIASEHAVGFRVPAAVPMFFVPGDVVLIERLSGREVKLQGVKYLIVNQVDILGKLGDAKIEE